MSSLLSQLEAALPPGKTISRDSRQTLSIQDLHVRSAQLAKELTSRKIKVLALHGDNSVNWMLIDIACQAASICLIPLPTFFSQAQLQHVFDSLSIDAVITKSSDLFNTLLGSDSILESISTCVSGYDLLLLEAAGNSNTLPVNTGKITFTSGSTGSPKGVCLSNRQLLLQANALVEAIGLENPRHLCLLPLSTLLENVGGIYAPLLAGGEVIIPTLSEIGFEGSSSLNPQTFVGIISHHQPDSIILTPQLLFVLATAAQSGWVPPASLKFVAVGGGKVSPALLQQARSAGIPAFEGYGLSECASVVCLNTAKEQKTDSCGRALPHLSIEIEAGEIVVSGNAMLGYLGEPESWGKQRVYTGDLGAIDADGFLQINGRKKNLLISSFGRNINPEWVESEFLAQPGIDECVVFGDDKPYCVALLTASGPEQTDTQLQHSIDVTNALLPDYARIKRWQRFPQTLTTQAGLMTDNGRPKRDAIAARHQQLIESLYPTI